jgi:hypothetical protein
MTTRSPSIGWPKRSRLPDYLPDNGRAERWTLPDAHALLVSVHDPLAAGLSRVHTEEVTGSNPVSPTESAPNARKWSWPCRPRVSTRVAPGPVHCASTRTGGAPSNQPLALFSQPLAVAVGGHVEQAARRLTSHLPGRPERAWCVPIDRRQRLSEPDLGLGVGVHGSDGP